MKKSGRYDTSKLLEAQFEPGSRGRVLKNLLGIKLKRKIDAFEKQEQLRALEALISMYDNDYCFTAADIRKIHKIWLGNIYEWAGKYRQVNVSKGDFHFAAATQVSKLMEKFEKELLKKFTPCQFDTTENLVKALAVVHTELLLIHPFREGNGRIARMLASLMAAQAGLPLLDFSVIIRRKKQEYITAVQRGMDLNYRQMENIFKSVIRRTLRIRGRV